MVFLSIKKAFIYVGSLFAVVGGLLYFSEVSLSSLESLKYSVSWIGNTFPGGDEQWVQDFITEIFVTPDGTVYTSSEWDEGGRTVGEYKDGRTNKKLFKENNGGEHKCWGWGTASKAIAADDRYLYVVNCEGNLLRFRRADQYYINAVPVGKAVDMTYREGILYILLENGEVQQREARSGVLLHSFKVPSAGDVAVDKQKRLWIRVGKEILAYSPSGRRLPLHLKGFEDPTDIAVDNQGRLIVCENGSQSQVLFYDVSSHQPQLVRRFGKRGGLLAGTPGVVKKDPLKLFSIRGAGTDAKGNLYVALSSEGWSIIRKFNPRGQLVWEVQNLFFVDGASFDPDADGKVIYGREEIIEFDYSRPPGQPAWTLRSITRDPSSRQDPRREVFGMGWIRKVRGHRLLFVAGQMAGPMPVLYFSPSKGDIALDSGLRKGKGWALWPDHQGNVWYVEGRDIIKEPLIGFSPEGKPVYGKPEHYPIPSEFRSVERIIYDVESDTMYLSGFTKEHPDPGGAWGLVGTEIIRYDNWSKGPKLHTRILLPFRTWEGGGAPEMIMPKAIAFAGDYLFVAYVWNFEGPGNKPPVLIYHKDTGQWVGTLRPGGVVGTAHGWVDAAYAIDAFRRSHGEYVVLVEEDYRGKIVLYRWMPG